MPEPSIPSPEVLAGARRVLDTHGWQGATLERIAAEAGISRVTLHRRGVTKEAILASLAKEAVASYRERMWPVLTGSGTARERLLAALTAICELAEENLSLLIALDAQANAAVFHESGDEEVLTRDEFTEPLERLLRDGAADGTIRTTPDPLETATVLFNLVGWTYIHLRSGHHWQPARARDATIETLSEGLHSTGGN